MIYSCWDPTSGLYDYFVDKREIAINADLPVPSLPAPGNRIGVAALEAGRSLPSGAKRAGRGWHARGLVVQCGRGTGSKSGMGSVDSAVGWVKDGGWLWIAAAGVLYFVGRAKL